MTIRDEYAYAVSPTIEYVTATDMNRVGAGFGRTRLIGYSTPGENVTNGFGLSLDHVQSSWIRVFMSGKRQSGTIASGQVYLNIRTRHENGGPSTDHGDFFTPGLWEEKPGGRDKDPYTWIESGRVDRLFDTNGFMVWFNGPGPTQPYPVQYFWIQLCLMGFTQPVEVIDANHVDQRFASPAHQKLWLSIWPFLYMDYVRDVIVWEWERHPETPTRPYTGGGLAQGGGSEIGTLDASQASEGMGSKYDIFTGV